MTDKNEKLNPEYEPVLDAETKPVELKNPEDKVVGAVDEIARDEKPEMEKEPEEVAERALDTIVTPGQLVLKRFLRNKLAIVGLLILLIMFLFSFVGPVFAKYGEYERSFRVEPIEKAYITTGDNHLIRLRLGDGLPDWDVNVDRNITGDPVVSTENGIMYLPVDGGYYTYDTEQDTRPEMLGFIQEGDENYEEAVEQIENNAYQAENGKFEGISWKYEDGKLYEIKAKRPDRPRQLSGMDQPVFAENNWFIKDDGSASFAVSDAGVVHEYRTNMRAKGWEVDLVAEYNVEGPFRLYKNMAATKRINSRAMPSSDHWLGTDKQGFDVFTRLMYGGRISLMVGFAVVLIELILGTIMGGIAGYYGKWVDSLIMRLVDIFFCIPSMPLIMMINTSLTKMKLISSESSIFILMFVLGVLGWAGVARFVRGQILSLREQEYMIAAEATGLKVRHRIFRHLIPNVLPLLIVMATLGIGGTILFESSLSFLGFGLQYPYASWGNMVHPVTDPIVMKQYMHIWIPPGMCILLTVMAFNFVGDGLRDALDPKMKR